MKKGTLEIKTNLGEIAEQIQEGLDGIKARKIIEILDRHGRDYDYEYGMPVNDDEMMDIMIQDVVNILKQNNKLA